MKKRADVLIYENGYTDSREKAKALIMQGLVYINEVKVDKPGNMYDENTSFVIKNTETRFVGRGGYKLLKAIELFNINLDNKICGDIGASTGGFTDCMLQFGVKKVYAIDVGYGQLDYKLRQDDRVIVMERVNARYLDEDSFSERFNFVSIDVSFISLKHILPAVKKILENNGEIVALVKPQFEAGREHVGKNGIVRDKNVHEAVLIDIINFVEECQLQLSGITFSPIKGSNGNIEFLIYLKNNNEGDMYNYDINNLLNDAYTELAVKK